jgi:hypothetical protein
VRSIKVLIIVFCDLLCERFVEMPYGVLHLPEFLVNAIVVELEIVDPNAEEEDWGE